MGAQLQLASETLAVEPGKSLTTAVTVRNTGTVVDRFTFEALGAAAEWVTFAPDSLSLFPEATGTVNVIVAPPRLPTVPPGPVPFGVRAVSSEDPAGSAAEEGTLEIAAFSDVSLELLPRVVHGRRAGLARLAVDNRSNIPYDGTLSGADSAAALQFAFRPPIVVVPPGGAEFVRIRVRPVHPFWRGAPATKPFQLSLADENPPHPPRLQADGTMVQEAILPKWLMALVAAIVALALLGVLLWYTLLRPQIRSTAKNAANQQLSAAGLNPSSGGSSPTGGTSGSGGGSGGGGGSSSSTTIAGSNSSQVGPGTGGGTGSLTVDGSSVAQGNGSRVIYTVPSGRSFQVTDLLIQNAAGDNGTLTLARNGDTLMQWSMADFRDLDYHWVSPTVFSSGEKIVMNVSGCSNTCHPGIYYAGNLVKTS